MGNPVLRDLFYGFQKQMESKLMSYRQIIGHPVVKGEASEQVWIKWLSDYLPKRYSVDKAIIIDCKSQVSDQIDVVIYDRQYSPFVLNQDSILYIPAESVYAIFEVKQDLSKEHIDYAGDKAASVRKLYRTSATIVHAGGMYDKPKEPPHILAGILALSSTWAEPLGESFEKNMKSLAGDHRLDLGCALDSGSFFVQHGDSMAIEKSTEGEALIFFFLKLLSCLQKLGTVPAMEIDRYAEALDSPK